MSKLGEIIKQIKDGAITVVHIRDIDFNTIEDGELKDLARLIQDMGELSSVNFRNVNFGSVSQENLDLIFGAIGGRDQLKLGLPDNNLGAFSEKFLLIMRYLMRSRITSLNLSANNLFLLTEDALSGLLDLEPSLVLRELDFSDNQLGRLSGGGLLALGQYLILCRGVSILQLYDNALGANLFFCEFLERLQQLPLEEINLAGNEVGELAGREGETSANVRRVIESLARFQTLQRLSLADNSLFAWEGEDLRLFFSSLSRLVSLKRIDLRANQFGDLSGLLEKNHFLLF